MPRKSEKEVWVVTGQYYKIQKSLALVYKYFRAENIKVFYRDYYFEPAVKALASVSADKRPSLIVTDGTCKTRDEYGQSVSILYPDAKRLGRENGITVLSTLALRLKLFVLYLLGHL